MSKVRPAKPSEIMRVLEKVGFRLVRQRCRQRGFQGYRTRLRQVGKELFGHFMTGDGGGRVERPGEL